MALTLAIPLSGLDICHFHGIHGALCGSEISPIERPISPSTRSDSSGISSLTTITDIITPSLSPVSRSNTPSDDGNNNARSNNRRRIRNSTPANGLSNCPIADLCRLKNFHQLLNPLPAPQLCRPIPKPPCRPSALQEPQKKMNQRVVYGNRDILNLGANLRSPFWRMRVSEVPSDNIPYYMENRSIYHRLGDYALTEEYPTTHCKDCDFGEPSTFIFHGLRC